MIAVLLSSVLGCSIVKKKPMLTADDYLHVVREHIGRHYHRPYNKRPYERCSVWVRQDDKGHLQSIEIKNCDASPSDQKAILRAVEDASPLPLPENASLFDPMIEFSFGPFHS